jgi:hypothetical protein
MSGLHRDKGPMHTKEDSRRLGKACLQRGGPPISKIGWPPSPRMAALPPAPIRCRLMDHPSTAFEDQY